MTKLPRIKITISVLSTSSFRKAGWSFLAFLLFLSSCSKESDPITFEPQFGKEFYPTQVRSYRDYRVDSSYFNRVAGPDTLFHTFFLREVLSTVINLNDRDTTYRLERYLKSDSVQDWLASPSRIYSVTTLPEGVLRVEENVKILALRYPFRIGTSWNGNQYNSLTQVEQLFRAQGFSTRQYAGITSDSVLTILEAQDSSCLGKTEIFTRYIRGIGPVERFRSIFEYVQDQANPCPDSAVVRRVHLYSQKLIGYGRL